MALVGLIVVSALVGAYVGKNTFERKNRNPIIGAVMGTIFPVVTSLMGWTLVPGLAAFVLLTSIIPRGVEGPTKAHSRN